MINHKSQIVLNTIDEALDFIQSVTEIDQEDIEAVAFLISDKYPNLGKVAPPKGIARYVYRTSEDVIAKTKFDDAADRGIYVEKQRAVGRLWFLDAYPYDAAERNFLRRRGWLPI